MADNYLEYARENYEKRKAEWLRKKKHMPKTKSSSQIKKSPPPAPPAPALLASFSASL